MEDAPVLPLQYRREVGRRRGDLLCRQPPRGIYRACQHRCDTAHTGRETRFGQAHHQGHLPGRYREPRHRALHPCRQAPAHRDPRLVLCHRHAIPLRRFTGIRAGRFLRPRYVCLLQCLRRRQDTRERHDDPRQGQQHQGMEIQGGIWQWRAPHFRVGERRTVLFPSPYHCETLCRQEHPPHVGDLPRQTHTRTGGGVDAPRYLCRRHSCRHTPHRHTL